MPDLQDYELRGLLASMDRRLSAKIELERMAPDLARALLAERAERQRVEARILAILDGQEDTFVLHERNGVWDGMDRCVHGRLRTDGCDYCFVAALRAALAGQDAPRAGGEVGNG